MRHPSQNRPHAHVEPTLNFAASLRISSVDFIRLLGTSSRTFSSWPAYRPARKGTGGGT